MKKENYIWPHDLIIGNTEQRFFCLNWRKNFLATLIRHTDEEFKIKDLLELKQDLKTELCVAEVWGIGVSTEGDRYRNAQYKEHVRKHKQTEGMRLSYLISRLISTTRKKEKKRRYMLSSWIQHWSIPCVWSCKQ